jgi:hypothetical protein
MDCPPKHEGSAKNSRSDWRDNAARCVRSTQRALQRDPPATSRPRTRGCRLACGDARSALRVCQFWGFAQSCVILSEGRRGGSRKTPSFSAILRLAQRSLRACEFLASCRAAGRRRLHPHSNPLAQNDAGEGAQRAPILSPLPRSRRKSARASQESSERELRSVIRAPGEGVQR